MLMYRSLVVTTLCLFMACSPSSRFRKDEALFNQSKLVQRFRSISDMNDSYFDIRENNFVEFYRQLFDSVKNTSYPGKYIQDHDTMILSFYNKEAYTFLAHKAYIDRAKKEIIFFDHLPGVKKK